MGNMQNTCQLLYTFKIILQVVNLAQQQRGAVKYFTYLKYVQYLSATNAHIFYLFKIRAIFGCKFYVLKIGTKSEHTLMGGAGGHAG
jgi:hypothetical protein